MKKIILLAGIALFSFAISAQTPANNAPKGKPVTKELKQEPKTSTEHKCTEHKDHNCKNETSTAPKACCDKGKDPKGCAEHKGEHKCGEKGADHNGCCDKGKDHQGCPGHERKDGSCCKEGNHHGCEGQGHHHGRDFGQERAKTAKNKVEKEKVVKEVAQEVDQKIVNTKNRVQEARTAVQTQYKNKKITKAQYEEKLKHIDAIEKDIQRIETERQTTDKVIKAKVS